jgi:VanZ family protein
VYLSLKPSPEVPDLFWNADKVIHCLAYLWLALLPAFVVKPPQRLVLVCVGLFLLGVTLEFGQMYIPGRTFSLADMGANGIGVGLGFSIGKRVAAHGLFKFFLKI